MNHESLIDGLAENIAVFESLLTKIPEKQVCWKPAPEKWSILEVVNHLFDEEREDFRYRLRSLLENPDKVWPPIAPEEWVLERGYAQRNYKASLSNFLREREESIRWLRGLSTPNWKANYRHPRLGPMSAEMILANWLAHDFLHFRQIVSLKYGYLESRAESVSLQYAGRW